MSLDYEFCVASELDPQHILGLVMAELGLVVEARQSEDGCYEDIVGPGFLTYAYCMPAPVRMVYKESLAIEPKLAVHFTLAYDPVPGEWEQAVASMLRGVLAVIRQVQGDAVLVFNGDYVLLLRREGHLVLDTSSGLWNPERLSLVTMPHTLKGLPTM
ncbi:SitI3 family protein [Archangium lipolyticum]|uniref:SitI3 family protein n=1 Tax=Archangium lipolyticum TaxID=2970465 RepID=UPI00214A2E04|nr:SitI3 family protein [Archangium lipolyticum]